MVDCFSLRVWWHKRKRSGFEYFDGGGEVGGAAVMAPMVVAAAAQERKGGSDIFCEKDEMKGEGLGLGFRAKYQNLLLGPFNL